MQKAEGSTEISEGIVLSDQHSRLSFEEFSFSEYERQLITGNRCEALLEMKTVFHGDSIDIFYDTERYLNVYEVLRSGLSEKEAVFSLCRGFLDALITCGDYLLAPEELSFKNAHVYCTRDLSAVRFMYIPKFRNHISIREKLVDMVDTAIEYGEGDDFFISSLSEYKSRMYTGGQELRSLSILTEETIRRHSSEHRMLQNIVDSEQGETEKRREKGIPVKFLSVDRVGSGEMFPGSFPAFIREEKEVYDQKREKSGNALKLGERIKNLFNDLVS